MTTLTDHKSTAPGRTPDLSADEAKTPLHNNVAAPAREFPARRSVWRTRLVLLAKLVVAAGLLSWLLMSGRLDIRLLVSVPVSRALGLLVALTVGSMVLPAVRWWWLLRVQQLREPPSRVLSLTWAGYFAALVLPGAASGDLAKSYLLLRRQPKARARAFSTILADRFIGIYGLLCLGSLAILWLAGHGEMTPSVRAMAGGTLALLLGATLALGSLLFVPSRKLLLHLVPEPWREAWNESFELYSVGKAALLGCFCLSVASNAMAVACFAVAGSLLGDAVRLDAAFLAGPLVFLANCLPLSPGGIGVAETASNGLFASLGISSGAEMMVLLRVCIAMVALPGVAATISATASLPPKEQEHLE